MQTSLESAITGAMPVDILVGLQWGDEGKGRISHLLAPNYDMVCRAGGGPNAKHTVYHEGKKFELRHIPAGIFYPDKTNFLGGSILIDPNILFQEFDALKKSGFSIENIRISNTAHVILPRHREMEMSDALGTTRHGIGPAMMDKVNRSGQRMQDLTGPFREKLTPHLVDGMTFMQQALEQDKKILIEGSQGTMLDLEHGTYPYVTAQQTTALALAANLGIPIQKIRKIFGVASCVPVRLGHGPFPSEVEVSEEKLFRQKTKEYAKRVGYFDLELLQKAVRINGCHALILTHADCILNFKGFPVFCGQHREKLIVQGLDELLELIETTTGVPVEVISVGKEREDIWQNRLRQKHMIEQKSYTGFCNSRITHKTPGA